MRKEAKSSSQVIKALQEEKEHLIQLLELKTSLLQSPELPVSRLPQDLFRAMQKLSLFIINKGKSSLDEGSQKLLRSVYNENSTRLIEYYERKVEEQRQEIEAVTREAIEMCNKMIKCYEVMAKTTRFQSEVRGELERLRLANSMSETLYRLSQEQIIDNESYGQRIPQLE